MRPALSLTDAEPRTLLAVYLGDHLAGAVAGLALARRCRRSNPGNAVGRALAELVPELEEDRAALERLMDRLGVEPPRVKLAAAAAAERAGRLKLNGQLLGYSPLSRLVELEGLATGIGAKERLWRALEVSLGTDAEELADVDPAALAARAAAQRERVEALRLRAADAAFSTRGDDLST